MRPTRLFAGFAIGAWAAPYYRSAFPTRQSQFALVNALIVAGGGTTAAVSGGVIAALSAMEGGEANKGLLPLGGALIAISFWLLAVRTLNFHLAMGSLLLAYLAAETWYGATIAMMQGALPRSVWGTAQGTLNLVQIVANLSPLLLGLASLTRRRATAAPERDDTGVVRRDGALLLARACREDWRRAGQGGLSGKRVFGVSRSRKFYLSTTRSKLTLTPTPRVTRGAGPRAATRRAPHHLEEHHHQPLNTAQLPPPCRKFPPPR